MEKQRIGRFELLSEVDRDDLSVAYSARDTHLGRLVQLRLFRPHEENPSLHPSDGGRWRFLEQTRAAGRLVHPSIPMLLMAGEHGSSLYAVYETRPGTPLLERLQVEGPLPLHEAIAIGRQVADALAWAHQHGVFHGSLGPREVVVASTGRVTVLGIHEPAPDDQQSLLRLEEADLKCAARVLWASLVGLSTPLPTEGPDAGIGRGASARLARLVASCLLSGQSPSPGLDRAPRTCSDLRALLMELDGQPASAAPSLLSREKRLDVPRPLVQWTIGVGGALTLGCLLTQTWQLGALGAVAGALALLSGAWRTGLAACAAGVLGATLCLLAGHL